MRSHRFERDIAHATIEVAKLITQPHHRHQIEITCFGSHDYTVRARGQTVAEHVGYERAQNALRRLGFTSGRHRPLLSAARAVMGRTLTVAEEVT